MNDKIAGIDPLVGKALAGRYVIVRPLGEGGMGTVYVAEKLALGKHVALKVLHGQLAKQPEVLDRFLQEAKAASRIGHPHVIDITDFGRTDDGYVFIAMELCDGRDLHDEMAATEGHRLPWRRSRRIALQVCAALAAAHEQGVIHRDLKPENIFLTDPKDGRDFVKLLDFGIAKVQEQEASGRKLTQAGTLCGTPEYMSPEQARGDPIDHRVDIYAMGCLIYRMIAGRVPFEGDNPMKTLHLQMTAEPSSLAGELAALGAPAEVEAVIMRALAKDPDARYADANEMAADLRRASPGKAAEAAPKPAVRVPTPQPAPPTAPATSKRGFLFAAFVLVIVAVGGFAAWKLKTPSTADSAVTSPPDPAVAAAAADAQTTAAVPTVADAQPEAVTAEAAADPPRTAERARDRDRNRRRRRNRERDPQSPVQADPTSAETSPTPGSEPASDPDPAADSDPDPETKTETEKPDLEPEATDPEVAKPEPTETEKPEAAEPEKPEPADPEKPEPTETAKPEPADPEKPEAAEPVGDPELKNPFE